MPSHDFIHGKKKVSKKALESCVLVLFGATGDLTRRKIIPALYRMMLRKRLPDGFAVIAFARRKMSQEEFCADMLAALRESGRVKTIDMAVWKELALRLYYHESEFDDAAGYIALGQRLALLEKQYRTLGNRLFYFATPPDLFGTLARMLSEQGMVKKGATAAPWYRVVIEKPFGSDLKSAHELNASLSRYFAEEQIFRIDHYLGKELVNNIMVLRFANPVFEDLLNNRHVDHVQITVSEQAGVGSRGPYYDNAGAIRDFLQNHMLQIISLIGMDSPITFSSRDIHDEKVKVLRSLRHIPAREVAKSMVVGQYGAGSVEGERVKGYRAEDRIPKDSMTETFVALRLEIDNDRWHGVPFYVRTGKRMAKSHGEIAFFFRMPRSKVFSHTSSFLPPNVLVIRLQPDEGMEIGFNVKVPGDGFSITQKKFDFCHSCEFAANTPEAYEQLLHYVMLGDSTFFTRWDEVELEWRFVDPLIGAMKRMKRSFPNYASGSWGPKDADALLARDGRRWRNVQ